MYQQFFFFMIYFFLFLVKVLFQFYFIDQSFRFKSIYIHYFNSWLQRYQWFIHQGKWFLVQASWELFSINFFYNQRAKHPLKSISANVSKIVLLLLAYIPYLKFENSAEDSTVLIFKLTAGTRQLILVSN